MKNAVAPVEQYVIDFVRKLRIEKGYTQEQLGYIIGVSKVYVSNIEKLNHNAKYNLKHINALADHFGISLRLFFPEKAII